MSTAPRRAAKGNARLIVRTGGRRYAIPAEKVREIVRLPRVTPVPLGPPVLVGLGNVRGETLAILAPEGGRGETTGHPRQVLVLEGADRIGLAVDAVERLELSGERMRGGRVRNLPLDTWLREAFPVRETAKRVGGSLQRSQPSAQDETVALLRFALAGQSFALPLDQVAEVTTLPAEIVPLPGADAAVLGTMLWRERTLGLLSLSVLLGLGAAGRSRSREQRIVIIAVGGNLVGLLVDRLEGLLQVARERVDPVPLSLQDETSEARIAAICRPASGGLVSVLAADHLLSEARTRQILVRNDVATKRDAQVEMLPFLLLAIGNYRLALPLVTVEQVAHIPEHLTSLPGAPAWVLGITQMGGVAIVIIDQVLRLSGTPSDGARRRLIVVEAHNDRVGFLVDEACNIIHVDRAALTPAPLPKGLASGIFSEALSVDGHDETLLLLDPAAMISSAERDFILAVGERGSVDAA